jgi:hypothetical protein
MIDLDPIRANLAAMDDLGIMSPLTRHADVHPSLVMLQDAADHARELVVEVESLREAIDAALEVTQSASVPLGESVTRHFDRLLIKVRTILREARS